LEEISGARLLVDAMAPESGGDFPGFGAPRAPNPASERLVVSRHETTVGYGAPKIAFSWWVNNFHFTMVYGAQITIVIMGFINQLSYLGGPHIVGYGIDPNYPPGFI